MREYRHFIDRIELIWVVGSLILSFHFAFSSIDVALGSQEPEITRFLCGSILGFSLSSSLALLGLCWIDRIFSFIFKPNRKETHELPSEIDSQNF